MSHLACYFLGSFRVTLDDEAATAFESAKVRALLAYLAIEHTRPHERETLAALLWPEQPDSVARQNLRQALYQLGQTFGKKTTGRRAPAVAEESAPAEPFLLVTRSTVQLNPHAPVTVDVAEFRQLLARCDTHLHESMQTCAECAERLLRAVELYRGELLTGFSVQAGVDFDEWYMCERENLNRLMHRALASLAAYYERLGQDERALGYAQRQISMEPWREEVYRQSMHLLARMGQRPAAIAQYETCRRVLVQELNIEPSRETTLLYEHILAEPSRSESKEQPALPNLPNLPTPSTRFIGREAEVAAVEELLSRPDVRVLCVTGPGGIGKTRVALEATRSLAPRFPGEVYFIDLSPVDSPELVAGQIANVLGVEEIAGRPLSAGIAAKLEGHSVLLLLDNFEQVVEAAPLLAGLVKAAPGLKLLVTSRIALPLRSAHEYPLPQMALPDAEHLPSFDKLAQYEAVRLFTERAAARKPDFAVTAVNAEAVVEVCRRLDGLPLALELAAARIKVLTPQAMLSRLVDRLKLLDSRDGDVPLRHRTMRNAIAWSYDLLSPAEQAVFRRLSAFSGSWTLEAAQAIAGACLLSAEAAGAAQTTSIEEWDVPDILEALADKSLVRISPGEDGESRYTMLETIREYAVEQAQASGEWEALHALHAAWYLALAERTWAAQAVDSPDSLIGLQPDQANLQAALLWLLNSDDPESIERAGVLAIVLGRFWDLHGHWSTGRRWFDLLLGHPRFDLLPAPLRAEVLSRAGWLAVRQSDLRPAEQHLSAGLILYESVGDSRVALVLNGLGVVALYGGDYPGAISLFEQGIARLAPEDETHRVTLSSNLAAAALFQGDHARARETAEAVLQAQGAKVPGWDWAQSAATLGVALLLAGELPRAGEVLLSGFHEATRMGYTLMVLYCLCGYAAVTGARGDLRESALLFGAFDANSKRVGWPMSSGFEALYNRVTTPVRSLLPAKEWASAYGEGYALSLGDVAARLSMVATRG